MRLYTLEFTSKYEKHPSAPDLRVVDATNGEQPALGDVENANRRRVARRRDVTLG